MSKKADTIRQAVDEVNSIKSSLIRELQRLEGAGCNRQARGLERIIGQLEGWQARSLGQ